MPDKTVCPYCGGSVTEKAKRYSCSCGFAVWKEIAGKRITPDILTLLLENGRTPLLDGFRTKSGRPFTASMVVKDKKVVLEFPGRENHEAAGQRRSVSMRVESARPGAVDVLLNSAVEKRFTLNFGLTPARLAECYGAIAGAKYVLYCFPERGKLNFRLSVNNRDFARYVLRERIPNRKEMRLAVEHLWSVLGEFAVWNLYYEPRRRTSLVGGLVPGEFPRGIFPWLSANIEKRGGEIVVFLDACPAVRAQFLASLRTAREEGSVFVLPAASRRALFAWLNAVRETPREPGQSKNFVSSSSSS